MGEGWYGRVWLLRKGKEKKRNKRGGGYGSWTRGWVMHR